ncbi:MAG: class I SAM-dependent methyltransferase [Gemmatirosa sp.]|nr:class I SAM-dependent methyltransferase [Gemmatirosa sp.]
MSEHFDLEPAFLDMYEACRHATMTSIERMYALHQATRHVVARDVPGDFVECGVWRGGSVMLMAATLLALGRTDRTIWLYDTFDGVTPPDDRDVEARSGRRAAELLAGRAHVRDDNYWGVATRAEVERNLRATGYPLDRFRLVAGDVATTLGPARDAMPETVAILRLDTDWYGSTRHELQQLYPRLARGGVLIVDDYGYWRGARAATDEYLATLAAPPLLHRIDCTGRIAVKP